jgi:tripartite-type tricarboxylate transporter receptor subunit TctC
MRHRSVLALCVALCAGQGVAQAQSVADFYKGKQIAMLTTRANSGNGIYARTLSRFMGKHIPGNPSVVIQEMPAAAGLAIMTHMYSIAPHDGLTMGTVDRGVLLEPLMGTAAAKFDASKMTSIASIGSQVVVCSVSAQSKIKTIQQAMQEETLVGALAPNTILAAYPALLNAVLHTKFKIITGYEGTQGVFLAMERGEVDGICGAWSTLKADRPDWVKQNKVRLLLQVSFTEHPELKGVPKLSDFVKDETARNMLNFYASPDVIGRPYLAPPDVPADRVEALRRAFDATMDDAGFKEEAKKLNLEIEPVKGEEMQKRLAAIYSTPSDILRRIYAIREANQARK